MFLCNYFISLETEQLSPILVFIQPLALTALLLLNGLPEPKFNGSTERAPVSLRRYFAQPHTYTEYFHSSGRHFPLRNKVYPKGVVGVGETCLLSLPLRLSVLVLMYRATTDSRGRQAAGKQATLPILKAGRQAARQPRISYISSTAAFIELVQGGRCSLLNRSSFPIGESIPPCSTHLLCSPFNAPEC